MDPQYRWQLGARDIDRARAPRLRQAALLTSAAVFLCARRPGERHPHARRACSPGYESVKNVDPDTYFDGSSNLTICLDGDLEDFADHDVQWSNMSHVTVRSAPGSWRSISSRIWIDGTSSDVTLYGLTLDASGFDAVAGQSGIAINGDRVALQAQHDHEPLRRGRILHQQRRRLRSRGRHADLPEQHLRLR